MHPTLPYISDCFSRLNARFFQNELPQPAFKLTTARSYLGMCCKSKQAHRLTPHFTLKFSTSFDLPEAEWEDTVLHEMIHYYIGFKHLHDDAPHGSLFRHFMHTFNKQGRCITISHKADDTVKKPDRRRQNPWNVVAVAELRDGTRGVKVLPRIVQRIAAFNKVWKNDKRVKSLRFFLTNHDIFDAYPSSSATYLQSEPEEGVMTFLKDAKRIKVEGDRVSVED